MEQQGKKTERKMDVWSETENE